MNRSYQQRPDQALGNVYRRHLGPLRPFHGQKKTPGQNRTAIQLAALTAHHPQDSVRPTGLSSEDENPDDQMQRLEAVLFLAREPLTSRKLSQYANLADGTRARTLIRRLNQKLDKIGRSFRVEEIAGGFQFVTRSRYSPWLRRLEHVPREIRLSAPAMETLAVVSYRQPVIRADIEAVRGVSCGEILNQLLNRDLIRISGRSEELGRPYLYSTTKNFLRLFGLRSLEELPRNDYLTGSSEAEGEVEEERNVSVLVEQEMESVNDIDDPQTIGIQPGDTQSDRDIRMDDEDYDYDDEQDEDDVEEDDEDYDDESFDEEEVEEEGDDEDDEEFDYEEDDESEEGDDEEDDEYEYEEDDESDDEEEFEDDDVEDGDYEEDEYDDDEEDDEEVEDDWEEVDDDESDESDDVEDDEDWDDEEDDWDDDEEWE